MIAHRAVRARLWRPAALLALAALSGCQSARHAEPERISFRQDMIFAPPLQEPLRNGEPVSAHIRQAAQRGTDWLMATRRDDGAWDGPHPVAVAAIALSGALRDERFQEPSFQAFWEETVEYLVARQAADGGLSPSRATEQPYEHALATRALCEALPLSANVDLRTAAGNAVRYILDRQQVGGGWHYGYAQGHQRSTPLVVTQMEALFAAAQQGLYADEIVRALNKAAQDLTAAQSPDSGRYGYLFRGVGQSVINGYALYGLQLAGHGLSLSARKGWSNALGEARAWPASLQWPLFAAYYSHQAAYHLGGVPWKDWQDAFYRELLAGQHDDGHWPAPFQESALGPPYATALAVSMIRSTDRTPRLVAQYDHGTPGPLYRLRSGSKEAYLLSSALIEEADAALIDAWLTDILREADTLWVEGSPREWMHHLSTIAAAAAEAPPPDPLSRELRSELNRLFGLPPTASGAWNKAPPWALALLVWGHHLEEAERSFESTVEHHIQTRFASGQRAASLIPPDEWAAAFESVSREEGLVLLRHALNMRADAPLVLDRLADAWCMGDEGAVIAWTRRIHGSDPAVPLIYDRLFEPIRARLTETVSALLAEDARPLIVLPVWHLHGPDGVLARLQERGHTLERIP